MKWFYKWLRYRLNNSVELDLVRESTVASPNKQRRIGTAIRNHNEDTLDSNPIRFNLYYANGGVVVETRMVDHLKDRVDTRLHVIQEGEDLGKNLEQIITMMQLRNL